MSSYNGQHMPTIPFRLSEQTHSVIQLDQTKWGIYRGCLGYGGRGVVVFKDQSNAYHEIRQLLIGMSDSKNLPKLFRQVSDDFAHERRSSDLGPSWINNLAITSASNSINHGKLTAAGQRRTSVHSRSRSLDSIVQALKLTGSTLKAPKTDRPRLRGLPPLVVCLFFIPPFLLFYYLRAKLVQSSELYAVSHAPAVFFLSAFIFRYYRLVVHIFSFLLTKPIPVPAYPTVTPHQDVTVIVPTVGPDNPDFEECIYSICANRPAELHIVVSSDNLIPPAAAVSFNIAASFGVNLQVSSANVANKRRQLVFALGTVPTRLVCFVDDHVFWPEGFLISALAPFEDSRVGTVATTKRVRRLTHSSILQSFFNVLGALYLERHNFEILATNSIDNGVFVVSGRTCLHRTAILQSKDFCDRFCNEMFFFGMFGPLNADDDNFIYRHVVRQGWDVVVQCGSQATIETTVGEYPKFLQQCTRWVRTTWRSNLCSLLTDRTVWKRQLWCVYAVHLSSLVNFALFYDALLVTLLFFAVRQSDGCALAMGALGSIMLLSKMVKTLPYFVRHPADLVFWPGCILFGYYHSLKKLHAGLTFFETAWGSRKNVQ
jgi:cellulose synthase/poly-beta-1,6-N-acetylglucosamine synthase-like glycosyltransferase